MPTISYGVIALIILLLIFLPLIMVFCLLCIASQEDAEMGKLAGTSGVRIDFEAVEHFGRDAGGEAPDKPRELVEAKFLS